MYKFFSDLFRALYLSLGIFGISVGVMKEDWVAVFGGFIFIILYNDWKN